MNLLNLFKDIGGIMSGNGGNVKTQGLDTGVSSALLQQMSNQNASNNNTVLSMHKESMQSMQGAMDAMQRAQASADQKYASMVNQMQVGFSNSMAAMNGMVGSIMNMLGPVLMGGMAGGMNSSFEFKSK